MTLPPQLSPIPLRFVSASSSYEKSLIVIFGIPFDGTTTFRPGTRFGPNAIREASQGLEDFSPSLEADLTDIAFCDLGDLSFSSDTVEDILKMVKNISEKILADGKSPLALGGEHLLSLPMIESTYQQYPDLKVLHLDAHADLLDSYLGRTLSHATVMRRVRDLIGGENIFQVGIRSGTKEEWNLARENSASTFFGTGTVDPILSQIGQSPVYITLDLDVLDPGFAPGVGTPEPGGISPKELFSILYRLKGKKIVGADLVELTPNYDPTNISAIVAAKTVRELLLLMNSPSEESNG